MKMKLLLLLMLLLGEVTLRAQEFSKTVETVSLAIPATDVHAVFQYQADGNATVGAAHIFPDGNVKIIAAKKITFEQGFRVELGGKFYAATENRSSPALAKNATATLENKSEVSKSFELAQNFPNPFNPSTVISYQLSTTSLVRLDVFDMLGRRVTTLVNEAQPAGTHSVLFNAATLASGVYFYRLQAGNNVATKKMMLVK